MTNFILEEQKLVFVKGIEIVEEVFANRVLCHDRNHHLFVIKKGECFE